MKKILVLALVVAVVLACAAVAFATQYNYSVVLPALSGHTTLVTGTKSISPAKHALTSMGGDYDAVRVWVDAYINGAWQGVTDRCLSYEGSGEITLYYNQTVANGTSLRGRGQNADVTLVTVSASGYFKL